MKTIIGEYESVKLTDEEYNEWIKYDEDHPWLNPIGYFAVLNMFLSHFRRGINLNKK